MILISARLLVSETPGQKPETLREGHMQYDEVLKEVRSALKDGFELTYIVDDEFIHAVSFLKYRKGDQFVMMLVVRGTREEINNLQIDSELKNS